MAQILYTPVGDFVHLVDFLDPAGAPRNSDGSDPDPTSFASGVPAACYPLAYTSGTEVVKPHQVLPEVTHKIVIRYMPGILSRMLVVFYPMSDQTSGRKFVIMRIKDPDERRVELHLICSERNDGR